ncbi:hypothetical protein KJ910_00700 [Patescibacteria group bacterium]|nr:hypothetical protein [Patescibacteria group bacterium]MBU1907192.1 hypothetical protein [Patescibacteria group bacterium]
MIISIPAIMSDERFVNLPENLVLRTRVIAHKVVAPGETPPKVGTYEHGSADALVTYGNDNGGVYDLIIVGLYLSDLNALLYDLFHGLAGDPVKHKATTN